MKPFTRAPSLPTVLDRTHSGAGQGDGLFDAPSTHGRLGGGVLIGLRWLTLGAELTAVAAAALWLGLSWPLASAVGVIGAAALVNLALGFTPLGRRAAGPWGQALQLGFDVAQMSAILVLSGGVLNPFSLLLIAPATLAAASLPPRQIVFVAGLAAAALVAMSLWSLPPPWPAIAPGATPLLFRLAVGAAILTGIALTAGYAWRAAAEAARMELALNLTQRVLAREQRLSALGGLAAAAAHELGTPLATMAVVAKEMARQAPTDALKEDAELLVSQAERCREILTRLTEEPDTDDAVHARMTLLQFANEAIEPHLTAGIRVEAVVAGPPGARPPEIRRMPEVLHAMTSIVENAVDFARSEVLVSVRFDEASVAVEVRDDGPGFSPDILAKLGQPYVTSRPGAEGSRSGHIGMGLGFFISKTLLEHTGAVVDFHNAKGGGAVFAARWPREAIEAPPAPGGFELGVIDPPPVVEDRAIGT
ncbi:MAG TPA: ActS/PrrB/RegB family redox-sensitive histidine kinase [Caulobacteraceae bacterium]|nr:ActS/PrrB/RegB family redox-sensitive histidine kinase [Caulobacteraceae bacterium]